MEAIVEPSAGILVGYEAVLIKTQDKQTLYGFLVADGDNITIKDVTGIEHTIPKTKISSRKSQDASLMPRLQYQPKQLADLAAYLTKRGN